MPVTAPDSITQLPIYVNQTTSLTAKIINLLLRLFVRRRIGLHTNIHDLREFVKKLDRITAQKITDLTIEDCTANGVPCRWINAPSKSAKIILYFHGSGFCVHLPHTYDAFVAKLCREMDANALIANYRLAPEHPYPASVNDCFACYQWLLEQGYSADNIVIAGDSAGGGLTLTTLIQIREQQLAMPAAVILLSPGTQPVVATTNEHIDPMLSRTAIDFFLKHYIPQHISMNEPLLSPVNDSFEQFPPMEIHVGSTEIILDHALKTAEKATLASVDVKLHLWKDMPHVHPLIHWLPESKQAIGMITQFLNRHLSTT